MALKSVVDALDGVPEAFRSEYKEIDGKFVLDVDGINEHPTVVNLKTAHERQKQATKTASDEAKALKARLEGLPEDFDAAAYEALKSAAEGKGQGLPAEQAAQLRASLEKKHADAIKAMTEQLEAERGVATRLLVDDGLTKALVGANVRKELMDGAYHMLRGMVKVVDESGKRSAIVETDMGPMPLDKFVSEWAASDRGKAYVAPPQGAGATGSKGTGGAKTITRAEFDKLDPLGKHKAISVDKMTVVD